MTAATASRRRSGVAEPGRVDLAVAAVAGVSRAHAQRLLSGGRALVDGRARRASDRLRGGERVEVDLEPVVDPGLEAEDLPLSVLCEDDDLLVIDKPAGMVVHPAAGHRRGTLVNALVGRAVRTGQPLGSIAGVERPGIVHRLDKDTSGLLVVAKTDAAQAALIRQFGDRTVDKAYVSLVRGAPAARRGRIDAPIGRDPRFRQRMAVVGEGREAVTEYRVLDSGGGYTLLALHPRTGRTHQLRAHLAYLGIPVAGDQRYGGGIGPGGLRRQFLHAFRLGFTHPDGRPVRAWSALPADLVDSLGAAGLASDELPADSGAEVGQR